MWKFNLSYTKEAKLFDEALESHGTSTKSWDFDGLWAIDQATPTPVSRSFRNEIAGFLLPALFKGKPICFCKPWS